MDILKRHEAATVGHKKLGFMAWLQMKRVRVKPDEFNGFIASLRLDENTEKKLKLKATGPFRSWQIATRSCVTGMSGTRGGNTFSYLVREVVTSGEDATGVSERHLIREERDPAGRRLAFTQVAIFTYDAAQKMMEFRTMATEQAVVDDVDKMIQKVKTEAEMLLETAHENMFRSMVNRLFRSMHPVSIHAGNRIWFVPERHSVLVTALTKAVEFANGYIHGRGHVQKCEFRAFSLLDEPEVVQAVSDSAYEEIQKRSGAIKEELATLIVAAKENGGKVAVEAYKTLLKEVTYFNSLAADYEDMMGRRTAEVQSKMKVLATGLSNLIRKNE